SIFYGVRHGFLAVNVFAGGAGVLEDVPVLVVHGSNQDRVNILPVKNPAIVADRVHVGVLDCFAGGGVTAVVEITHRDALDTRDIQRRLQMFASANAGADGGEAHGIAGRHAPRSGVELMRLQNVFGDGGGGYCAGAKLNESTAGQGIF